MPNTLKILLVDDDLLVLELIKDSLALNPEFEIDTATSAIEGLQKLKNTVYDANVSGNQIPKMNGIEFLEPFRVYGKVKQRLLVG